jgi:hypothetical protein
MRLNQLTLKLSSLVIEIFITLIRNDHVMHDYKTGFRPAIYYIATTPMIQEFETKNARATAKTFPKEKK